LPELAPVDGGVQVLPALSMFEPVTSSDGHGNASVLCAPVPLAASKQAGWARVIALAYPELNLLSSLQMPYAIRRGQSPGQT
jgi:hypothetical protein